MKVNGQEAEPGCYIDGHWGQYGMDRVADVAEQFDIGLPADPRHWRCVLDDPESYKDENAEMTTESIFEQIIYTSELCVDRLNEVTEGGYWTWEDGEFFLQQTEIEAFVYYLGENYDDAWNTMREHGPDQGYLDRYQATEIADDQPEDVKVYQFAVTIRYEPDDAPEEWTNYEIVMGLDN